MGDAPEKPHPLNAPGPFYVVDGCCTSCGVPTSVAPDLFAWDDRNHCFVRYQPTTEGQTAQALQAIRLAELPCIRYRGRDPGVLLRLAELGEAALCDVSPRLDVKPVRRNHVTFDAHGALAGCQPGDFASRFREVLGANRIYRVRPVDDSGATASLAYAWHGDDFHQLSFRRVDLPEGRWLVAAVGVLAVSEELHGWLAADARISNIRWYSKEAWDTDRAWRPTPW